MRVSKMAMMIGAMSVAAMLLAGGESPAAAQCLLQPECNRLEAKIKAFRAEVKPLVKEARELRLRLRELPRGSDEWKAVRRQLRRLREELRGLERPAEIRRAVRTWRAGCKSC